MAESLPYLAAPGMITKCLEKISHAATPEKVTGDFVNTKLGIKGGAGRALVPLLKKIGFVNSDGTPTTLYKRFRNPAESEQAVAEAIKVGYKPLYLVNEYCHELNESELKSLIVQVTGQAASSNVVRLTVSTFQKLKALADFDSVTDNHVEEQNIKSPTPTHLLPKNQQDRQVHVSAKMGMNLSYTINLNLPATSDISVFNAIFKSLKENMLDSDENE
ncbi:MAG: DUF5343 domain-containing protein [Gallionella sp.]|jgi:hypothetical protein